MHVVVERRAEAVQEGDAAVPRAGRTRRVGDLTSFESEVAIDVDAGAEPAIFDDYFYADAAGAVEADVEADAEADAQRAADRAVAQAFAGFGFF
jgi:hypothetical protein